MEEARALSDAKSDRIAALERELGEAKAELARAEGRSEIIESHQRVWLYALVTVAIVAAVLLTIVLLLALSGGVAG